MNNEKTRIPENDVLDSENTSKVECASIVQEIISASLVKFETKEEFIKELLDNNEIKKDDGSFDDNLIHLKGNLTIDNRVINGLDWSDIVVDSASVIDGKISKYKYLPITKSGVKSNLIASNTKEFITHNVYGAQEKNGEFFIPGVFRVPNIEQLPDLSQVTADKIFWYPQNKKVKLENLPTAKNGFLGLAPENIIADGDKVAKQAKDKGLSKAVCKALCPSILDKIISNFKTRASVTN